MQLIIEIKATSRYMLNKKLFCAAKRFRNKGHLNTYIKHEELGLKIIFLKAK